MTIQEAYEFILPYIKGMKLKKNTSILVKGNMLVCIDPDWTSLYTCILPIALDYNDLLCGVDGDLYPGTTMVDFRLYNKLWNTYSNYVNYVPLHTDYFQNLEEDENFMAGVNLKASDSFKNYVFYGQYGNYLFPISYGLFPLSKGDKIDMEISPLPNDINSPFNTFLSKAIVHKKKLKVDINIYRRLIKY